MKSTKATLVTMFLKKVRIRLKLIMRIKIMKSNQIN